MLEPRRGCIDCSLSTKDELNFTLNALTTNVSHLKLPGPTLMSTTIFKSLMMVFLMGIAASASANDESEVLSVIQKWADLESDLESQSELIRDDRIQIAAGIRQTDQKSNLKVQVMNYEAGVQAAGGEPSLMVRIEDPIIRVYGNVAIASFVRLFNFTSYGERPNPPAKAWCTMVLVKEENQWKIAHHHISPA